MYMVYGCIRAKGNIKKYGSTFTVWMETQWQNNGDAITVGGQKPMLDNSMDKDWIA